MRKTTTAFLAYFDILGFQQIVNTLTPEELDKLYSKIMRNTQWAYADDGKQVDRITLHPVFVNSPIKAVNVSDSIVFFSKDDSEDSLKAILKSVSKFISWLETHCSCRGCVVHGSFNYLLGNVKNETDEIAYNVSAIYGKALIDAYKKAEAQEWVGFFIDNSVVKHSQQNGFTSNCFCDYIRYDVPYKENKSQTLLAYKQYLSEGGKNGESQEQQVKKLFERNGLKYTEDVRLKYENTLTFRKYCKTVLI